MWLGQGNTSYPHDGGSVQYSDCGGYSNQHKWESCIKHTHTSNTHYTHTILYTHEQILHAHTCTYTLQAHTCWIHYIHYTYIRVHTTYTYCTHMLYTYIYTYKHYIHLNRYTYTHARTWAQMKLGNLNKVGGLLSMVLLWLWYYTRVLQNVTIEGNWGKCTRDLSALFLTTAYESTTISIKISVKGKEMMKTMPSFPLPWA